ncbi:MAG: tRNA epoxyqueuosine(34) reductase QueG, partial [Terriglobales bacterium]
RELAYFPEWIASGRAGEMEYLKARDEHGRLKRAAVRHAAPWARSVVVCALNYNTGQPYSTERSDPARGWISRYAWGCGKTSGIEPPADYHRILLTRLEQVESELRRVVEKAGVASLQTRCYVDTGPIVERVYAKYAGVGWIGKNTCVINQQLGSWLFLGVILTSLELTPDLPAPDRCGSCTRCIDACPTAAIPEPYQLDATRCISYLTIEKRGSIPEGLRAGMGRHIFGCDICQDVCPWNRSAPASPVPEFQPRVFPFGSAGFQPAVLHPEQSLLLPHLEWLADLTEDEFKSLFRNSAIRRTKWRGLVRNACIALGNSAAQPGPEASATHTRILSLLRHLASSPDALIADHALWALSRLRPAPG